MFFIGTLLSCKNPDKTHEKSNEKSITVMTPVGVKKPQMFVGKEKFESKKASNLTNEGIQYVKKGEFLKAEEKFREALIYEPNNPTILNNLGNFEDYMGYKNKAISFYKQAFISSDSSYYNAIYNLGRIYCKLGEYQESERILNYILDNFDEPEHQSGSSHLLATVYVQLKDCEKAKIYYLMSKKMFDSVPELKTLSQELAEEIMACEDGKID